MSWRNKFCGVVSLVIRAPRDLGANVTALHHHGLDEEPRLSLMHFRTNAAVSFAKGQRADAVHGRGAVARCG